MNIRARQNRPTIAELLEELDEIHKLEKAEIDVPVRQDRPNDQLLIKPLFSSAPAIPSSF